MTTRANGPLAALGWLKRGLNTGRNHPRAIIGGATVLMGAWLLPQVLQMLLLAVFRPGQEGAVLIAALTTVFALALLPPLMGGYLRMIHDSEQGRMVHAADIFQPFRAPREARRMVGFVFLVLLLQVLAVSLLGQFFHDSVAGLQDWMVRAMQIVQDAQRSKTPQPVQLPPLPEHIGGFLGLSGLVFLLACSVFALGLAQVALGGRRIGRALLDGIGGTAKNLLPLAVLAALSFALITAAFLVLLIVMVVLASIAALVHAALATAVVLPLYLMFIALTYVVLFGVAYQLWRDIAREAPHGAVGIEL